MTCKACAPPVILPKLLDDDDLHQIFDLASKAKMQKAVPDEANHRATHTVLYLQRSKGRGVKCIADAVWQTFRQHDGIAAVLARTWERVRAEADASGLLSVRKFDELNLRCCEFHEYREGGGLTTRGHIDAGSMLTVSVQLTHQTASSGRFTTTDANGVVTVHELARGDGIAFSSEMVHNVSTLGAGGERKSLVMELWTGPPPMV
jgi:hypothetical protein